MTEHKTWSRRLAEDPAKLLALNAPPGQVAGAPPPGKTPAMDGPPMTGLYIAPEETELPAVARALETGDTTGLPIPLASEITEARRLLQFRPVQVPGDGGVKLDAVLWTHLDGNPRPAVVMPSPWADMGWLAYAIQGLKFALRGYNVLAYTARGFGKSEGEVEVAGEPDIIDGSRALDFLISNTQQPPTKVGFLGDSYGSGISQLVAARDPRVHAVVALSTWGDLGQAFYENETRHVASVRALLGAAAKARLSQRTQEIFQLVLTGTKIESILAWAKKRSPLTYIDRLNSRKVPMLFSHAWHETLFPSNQTLEMFNGLVGPKRLNFSIGDHSGPEMTGVIGLPNRIWADAYRWFDRFLKGEANGIDTEGQIVSQVMWSRALEIKASWKAVTERDRRLYLAAPGGGGGGDGGLSDAPSTGWTMPFQTALNTVAEVADKIIESGYAEMLGLPKVYPTREIQRTDAVVWSMAAAQTTMRLRGIPRLHVTFSSSAPASSFIVYLLDANTDGNAHIITHAPFSAPVRVEGKSVSVDIELQATGYDLQAGRRLMLVIDSKDKFYSDENQPRATITISSPQGDPSYLDVPVAL